MLHGTMKKKEVEKETNLLNKIPCADIRPRIKHFFFSFWMKCTII